jgi:MYXO-CTERM domain-containing protein
MRGSLHFSLVAGSRMRAVRIGGAFALALSAIAQHASAAGTWTMAPPNTAAGGQAFGQWLLTDGRILSHGSALKNWVILTPDRKGDYSKGTWKSVASEQYGRGGAQQHVLKDGRFFQIGGEYVDGPACTPTLCKSGEIYDPIADKWTSIAPAPLDVGDTGTAILDDGTILSSTRAGNQIQIYDPVKDSWTMGSSTPINNGQENAWATLQNGGVLAVGYAKAGAAVYDPATGKWIRTGPVPSGFDTGDTGGISLMFDGRVYVYGLGKSYIYTPGASGADPGTWAVGPQLLNGNRAEDEFTDTTPWGMVWGALVTMTYGPGVVLQEFDPMTNMSTSIMPPPDKGNPYPIGYVNLPNGQVMVTCERNNWIYTSDLQPQDEWRPTVTSVVANQGNTYTLTGTQLSGLINGADEGDDMSMAENYPIVWLTNEAGDAYYCRTFNFSKMTPMKGNTPQTCQFTTPADLPAGTYGLHVSSVGVQAKNTVAFTVGVGTDPNGAGGASSSSGGASSAGGGGSSGSAGSAVGGASSGSGGATGASGSTGTGSSGAPASAGGKSGGTAETGGTTSGASGSVGQGTGGTPGAGNTGANNDGSSSGAQDSSGCGCRTASRQSPSALFAGLGLLGLAFLRRRRARGQS